MTSQGKQLEIQIDYLANHPEHIPTVAQWHHNEWGHLSPNITMPARIERLHSHGARSGIPTTFVALAGDQPVGSASLVTSDMSIREELTPWLAAVYVTPTFRNAGIGSMLVLRVMKEARELGVRVLYLYTPDRQSFYARLGWREREICDYRGLKMTVMQYEFTSEPAS